MVVTVVRRIDERYWKGPCEIKYLFPVKRIVDVFYRCRCSLIPDVSKRITYYPRIRGGNKMVRLLEPKT